MMPRAALSLLFIPALLFLLAACAGPRLPAPNIAEAHYDAQAGTVQVMVSGVQPATGAALVASDGSRYVASGVSLVSGFGFSGCCSGFGSGVGFGVPVGKPSVAEVSDQYVASALIPAPGDYPTNWSNYRLEVDFGDRPIFQPAPSPAS
jgi:hypothetical protein